MALESELDSLPALLPTSCETLNRPLMWRRSFFICEMEVLSAWERLKEIIYTKYLELFLLTVRKLHPYSIIFWCFLLRSQSKATPLMGKGRLGAVSFLKVWGFLMLIIQRRMKDLSSIRKLELDLRSNNLPLIFLTLEPKESRYP